MTVSGADVAELRSTARHLEGGAESLAATLKQLDRLISNGTQWCGPDADRFRSEWATSSARMIAAAADALRHGSVVLRRNADEQDHVSAAGGSTGHLGGVGHSQPSTAAPSGLNGLWEEVQKIPKRSSGYRVQEVVGNDGITRYIVYVAGTNAADEQTVGANIDAARGVVDEEELAALRRIIPMGSDVMLVGYSQGGMDVQNIAAHRDNGFNVTQIVTYGSPIRSDLDIPAVHLHGRGDPIPTTTLGTPGPYFYPAQNDNVHVYDGKSNVTGNGYAVHERGYGYLSEKWDEAKFAPADGVAKFRGTAVNTVDLGKDGAPL